jgi:hypothetical protein
LLKAVPGRSKLSFVGPNIALRFELRVGFHALLSNDCAFETLDTDRERVTDDYGTGRFAYVPTDAYRLRLYAPAVTEAEMTEEFVELLFSPGTSLRILNFGF